MCEGNEDPVSKISELIRPLQMSEGEKVELLSVKPTFLSRSTPPSPRRPFLSEVRPVIAAAVSTFNQSLNFILQVNLSCQFSCDLEFKAGIQVLGTCETSIFWNFYFAQLVFQCVNK